MKNTKKMICVVLLFFLLSVLMVSAEDQAQQVAKKFSLNDKIKVNDITHNELSDGDKNTKYLIKNETVTIDLGAIYNVHSFVINFCNQTNTKFISEVSNDGLNWEEIADYSNSNLLSFVRDVNVNTKCRFISIKFSSSENECSEIEVYNYENIDFDEKEEIVSENKIFKSTFKDIAETKYEVACEFLASLEIIDGDGGGEFRATEEITRAEFMKMVVNTLNLDITTMTEMVFSDVDFDNNMRNYIYTAYKAGLISGYDDSNFKPNDVILQKDAFAIVAKMLNFDKRINPTNAYPQGYIRILQNNGVLKHITLNIDTPIKRGDCAILLYNSLHSEPYTVSSLKGEDIDYEQVKGRTLFKNAHNVIKREGILEAVEQSSMFYVSSDVQSIKQTVVIGGNKFKYDIKRLQPNDYLGYRVTYYTKTTDEKEEIIFMTEKNNRIKEIDIEDINDFKNKNITYTDKNDKTQELKIDKNASLIINNTFYNTYENCYKELENIKNGFVTLIDNNSDLGYDLIKIKDYINDKASLVDAKKGVIITTKEKYDSASQNIMIKIFLDEKEVSIEDIKENDILSISKGRNNTGIKYVEMHIGKQKLTNVAISEIDSKKRVIINNEKYKLAPNVIIEDNVIGSFADVLFDGYGKVTEVRIIDNCAVSTYAFFIDGMETQMDKCEMLIANLDGTTQKKLCRSIINVNDGNNSSKCSIFELKEKLKKNNEGIMEQLIKYTTDKNDLITTVYLAQDGEDATQFSLDYANPTGKYKWAVKEFDYKYKVGSKTKTLVVPKDPKDLKNYKTSAILNGDETYNVKMYDSSDNREVTVIVIKNIAGTYIVDRNLAVVEKISMFQNDDGELLRKLYCYKGTNKNVYLEPYKDAFKNVGFGSLLNVDVSREGDVFRFNVITKENPGRNVADEEFNKFTRVENIKGTELKDDVRWYDIKGIPLYKVYRENQYIKPITISDLNIGDEMVINVISYKPSSLIVYE